MLIDILQFLLSQSTHSRPVLFGGDNDVHSCTKVQPQRKNPGKCLVYIFIPIAQGSQVTCTNKSRQFSLDIRIFLPSMRLALFMLKKAIIVMTQEIMTLLPLLADRLDFLVPIEEIFFARLFCGVKPFREESHSFA